MIRRPQPTGSACEEKCCVFFTKTHLPATGSEANVRQWPELEARENC